MLCAPSHLSASTAARAIRASGSHRLCTHLIGACLTASVNSAVRALHLTRVHRPAGCERADNLPYASRCPAPTRITREGHRESHRERRHTHRYHAETQVKRQELRQRRLVRGRRAVRDRTFRIHGGYKYATHEKRRTCWGKRRQC